MLCSSGTYAKELTFTLSSTRRAAVRVSLSPVTGSGPSSGTARVPPVDCLRDLADVSERVGRLVQGQLTDGDADVVRRDLGHRRDLLHGPGRDPTYTGPFTLPDGGSVVVTYGATDNAGNVEPTHTSATYKIDTVAPSVTLTTPGDGAIYRQGATVPGGLFLRATAPPGWRAVRGR